MDVIFNRELVRDEAEGPRCDPDHVVMCSAKSDVANLSPDSDFMYRTVVAYLPGAGVFYCARERRPAAVGLPNTPVHHDVSWLRIMEDKAATPGSRFRLGPTVLCVDSLRNSLVIICKIHVGFRGGG